MDLFALIANDAPSVFHCSSFSFIIVNNAVSFCLFAQCCLTPSLYFYAHTSRVSMVVILHNKYFHKFTIVFYVCMCLKACAQRFRYALFAFIHTQTYFEYYTLALRLASLVKKAVIYAYWTKELFDICRENVSHMATLPSVARHVIHADNLRPRH